MIYSYERKILTNEETIDFATELNRLRRRIVTTNGCFDLVHVAHLHLLEQAKRQGDYLFVLLNSDESVRKYKGDGRPVVNERGRAELIAGLGCVDVVTIFREDTPIILLDKIMPRVHVKGGSYIPERIAQEKAIVERYGGKLICLPLEEGFSTTNIIKKVLENGKS